MMVLSDLVFCRPISLVGFL